MFNFESTNILFFINFRLIDVKTILLFLLNTYTLAKTMIFINRNKNNILYITKKSLLISKYKIRFKCLYRNVSQRGAYNYLVVNCFQAKHLKSTRQNESVTQTDFILFGFCILVLRRTLYFGFVICMCYTLMYTTCSGVLVECLQNII